MDKKKLTATIATAFTFMIVNEVAQAQDLNTTIEQENAEEIDQDIGENGLDGVKCRTCMRCQISSQPGAENITPPEPGGASERIN